MTGYFEQTPERERVRAEVSEALRVYDLPSSSVREMNFREVPNQDWLGEWKKSWQPVELGRLVIAPPWSEVKAARDRVVIRIEPGMAFGTGTHETTRLCLKAIMRFFKGGSFLDVGTGTGILAIAAAKLFPDARVAACDTDPEAIQIARENARLNGVAERIDFRVGSVDESGREPATASADFVCANLTADVIVPIVARALVCYLWTSGSFGNSGFAGRCDRLINCKSLGELRRSKPGDDAGWRMGRLGYLVHSVESLVEL